MREFDSAGLRALGKVIGTSLGPPQIVDLQDELIQQVLGLGPFIRRGLAPGGMGGLFTARMLNTHLGSDTITTNINPYTLAELAAGGFIGNDYPRPFVDPVTHDVWITHLSALAVTGTGDFGGGFVGLIYDALGMGWRLGSGNAIAELLPLLRFDVETAYGNFTVLQDSNTGQSAFNQPVRVGGGADGRIRFETVKTGAGAATFELHIGLAVLPAGLGQDAE